MMVTGKPESFWVKWRTKSTIFLVLLFLGLLVLKLPHVWMNLGFLKLNVAIAQGGLLEGIGSAGDIFRRATVFASQNESAWRGLGLSLAEQGKNGAAVEAWTKSRRPISELIDQFYYKGLSYEAQEKWQKASDAYMQAIELGRLTENQSSDPYYRVGLIYHRKFRPIQPEQALKFYDSALLADTFRSFKDEADCYYRRGEVLRWQGADPNEYVASFHKAVQLNPKHIVARIWLGTAYYERDGDIELAETELRKVLQMNPQSYSAYLHLGDIYRQEGRYEDAHHMYSQAATVNPNREEARKRLQWLDKQIEQTP